MARNLGGFWTHSTPKSYFSLVETPEQVMRSSQLPRAGDGGRAWAWDELLLPFFRAADLAWPAGQWYRGRETSATGLKGCAGLVSGTASFCCDVAADGGRCASSTEHGAAGRRCLWHVWGLLLRLKLPCAHELSDGSDSTCRVLAVWTATPRIMY